MSGFVMASPFSRAGSVLRNLWSARGVVALVGIAALGNAGLSVAQPSAAAANAQPPTRPLSTFDRLALNAITCPSHTQCWLAGSLAAGTANVGAIVSVQAGKPGTPRAVSGVTDLTAISCRTPDICEAIGLQTAGSTRYAAVAILKGVPQPPVAVSGVTLSGVGCATTTRCDAIGGSSSVPFKGHGEIVPITNGKVGTPRAVSGVNSLDAITCLSATTCEAIGRFVDRSRKDPLQQEEGKLVPILHETPRSPIMLPIDSPDGIACTPISCEVVGNCDPCGYGYGSGVHVNHANVVGKVRRLYGSELSGIACETSTTCVVVGGAEIKAGSGPAVSTITNGNPGTIHLVKALSSESSIGGVGCPTSTSCVAFDGASVVPITKGQPGSPTAIAP